jgi:hypothetical protein
VIKIPEIIDILQGHNEMLKLQANVIYKLEIDNIEMKSIIKYMAEQIYLLKKR